MCASVFTWLVLIKCFVVRHPQMRGRIELLLKQNKLSKKHIKDILQVCVLNDILIIFPLLVRKVYMVDTLSMSHVQLNISWQIFLIFFHISRRMQLHDLTTLFPYPWQTKFENNNLSRIFPLHSALVVAYISLKGCYLIDLFE